MRISDWSSDVCSSDLLGGLVNKAVVAALNLQGGRAVGLTGKDGGMIRARAMKIAGHELGQVGEVDRIDPRVITHLEAGARQSVVQGKSVSVRVDLGGGRIMKKQNTPTKNEYPQ